MTDDRAYQLALSLLELGELEPATYRQLQRWGCSDEQARDAVSRGLAEHNRRQGAPTLFECLR